MMGTMNRTLRLFTEDTGISSSIILVAKGQRPGLDLILMPSYEHSIYSESMLWSDPI